MNDAARVRKAVASYVISKLLVKNLTRPTLYMRPRHDAMFCSAIPFLTTNMFFLRRTICKSRHSEARFLDEGPASCFGTAAEGQMQTKDLYFPFSPA
jgi:hypothetical protein